MHKNVQSRQRRHPAFSINNAALPRLRAGNGAGPEPLQFASRKCVKQRNKASVPIQSERIKALAIGLAT